HRNELEKAQEDQIGVTNQWKDRQTCAEERGLDWQQVQKRNDEFTEKQQQQQAEQQQALGGMPGGGPPGAAPPGGGKPPGGGGGPPKQPAPEAPGGGGDELGNVLGESLYPAGATVVHYPAAGPSPGVGLREAEHDVSGEKRDEAGKWTAGGGGGGGEGEKK